MPQLEWNDIDLLDFFSVEPAVEDGEVAHSYEVERNELRLLLTVWQYESVIQVSIFRSSVDDAIITFAAYVRDRVRFINDQRGRYLEIAGCITAPSRFSYIDFGDPFDAERMPIAITLVVTIDPDIQISFTNFEPRT